MKRIGESSTSPAKRTSPRRALELVAICPDLRGTEGLAIAVTISKPESGMTRRVFPHNETAEGLADALYAASEWLRAGAPSLPNSTGDPFNELARQVVSHTR